MYRKYGDRCNEILNEQDDEVRKLTGGRIIDDMGWGKTGTRGEICRNFNSHFFPCFYWEFKGKTEFLEISTNFSSCTGFTPGNTW